MVEKTAMDAIRIRTLIIAADFSSHLKKTLTQFGGTLLWSPNAGLQLRRAISIRAEGKKLLEKACYRAVSCKALLN